jgi:methyl-accepting chemotaxis protein
MDEVTQQNAALVEEAAAAAESLEEQARSLVQAVAMFKLEEDSRPVVRRTLPTSALRDATPKALPSRKARVGAGGTATKTARQLPATVGDSNDSWEEF